MRRWTLPWALWTLTLSTIAGCKSTDAIGGKDEKPPAEAVSSTAPASPDIGLEAADYGRARLKMEGAFDVAKQTANAVAFKDGERLKKVEIRTTDAYRRKERKTFIVQLAAPPSLVVAPGTYPVGGSAAATDSLTGTIIVHDDALHPYSWNPSGEVTFTDVDDRVRGRFRITVVDRDPRIGGSVKPKVLTALGEFDAVLGDRPK